MRATIRWFVGVGGVLLLGGLSMALLAQPPGGPPLGPPGGGPPGGGPPGGGFFRFPGPMGGPGGPGGANPNAPTALLGMPEVQRELGLNDSQRKQVQAAAEAQQRATQEAFAGFNPQELGQLSDDERFRRMEEGR